MKAIILSAGRGERLRPLTDTTPKPLIKAGKRRLIEYLIDALAASGINDIVINTAHLSSQFPQVLGQGERYGVTLHYSPEPAGGYETAGGIIHALPLLGDQPFLVVNGDIWTDYPFTQLIQRSLAPETLGHCVLVRNPPHHLEGDFSLSNGFLQHGTNNYTFSGIAIYHPKLFSGLSLQRLPLRPVLLRAIKQQQLTGEIYQGQWYDIGTTMRLQQLCSLLENH